MRLLPFLMVELAIREQLVDSVMWVSSAMALVEAVEEDHRQTSTLAWRM